MPERACLFVSAFALFFECVHFLPALTTHHGAPAEHCCISASLGVSLRHRKRPDPAGNGLRPENKKKKMGRGWDGGGKEIGQCIKEQKM